MERIRGAESKGIQRFFSFSEQGKSRSRGRFRGSLAFESADEHRSALIEPRKIRGKSAPTLRFSAVGFDFICVYLCSSVD
jgi:hypothetical protein